MIKISFWAWLAILVIINSIPIGNQANQSLSGNKLFVFRLDYLVHSIMILCFAVIWLVGKIHRVEWFRGRETTIYSLIVLGAAVGLELLQLVIPWRNFNPVDMEYNLLGAIGTSIVVVKMAK